MGRYTRPRVGRTAGRPAGRNTPTVGILTWYSHQPQEVDMPGDATQPDPSGVPMRSGSAQAREYLLAELRVARSEALRAGADPAALTGDLEERLRRVRQSLAADEEGEPAPGDR